MALARSRTAEARLVERARTYKRHGTHQSLCRARGGDLDDLRQDDNRPETRRFPGLHGRGYRRASPGLVAKSTSCSTTSAPTRKNEEWLAAHSNVAFHLTPTSANWLNQVEIWFGIFSRKALAGASFRNVEYLVQAISDFTEVYKENAAPFVWRKREVKGAQPHNTIVNLRN